MDLNGEQFGNPLGPRSPNLRPHLEGGDFKLGAVAMGPAGSTEEPFSNTPSSGESMNQIRARMLRERNPGMSEEESASQARQVGARQYHPGSDPHFGEAAGKSTAQEYAKRRTASEASAAEAGAQEREEQLRAEGKLKEPTSGPSGPSGGPGGPPRPDSPSEPGQQRKRSFWDVGNPKIRDEQFAGLNRRQAMPGKALNNYLLMNQLMARGGWQMAIRHAYGQPVSMESVFLQQAAAGPSHQQDQFRQDHIHHENDPNLLNREQSEGVMGE